jgi:cytochrome c biogenesis protein CcdA
MACLHGLRAHLNRVRPGDSVRLWCAARVLRLAITVVAIALPDCINPSLIAGELLVATSSRPRRRVALFTVGAWAVTFGFGVALTVGLGDLILSLVPQPSASVKYALVTAAGVVLIVGGVVIWVRRRSLASAQASEPSSLQHGSAAVIGAGVAGVELLTAFPYFAAIALIVAADVSSASKLFLVALYSVVYVLPLIVIAVVVVLMGDRAERLLRPLGAWMRARWPVVVGPLTVAFGIGVTALGITRLASV